MTVSKRFVVAATIGGFVAMVAAGIAYRVNRVDDPADAECARPAITLGDRQDQGDHQELEVQFRCEGAVLAGTIYLPESAGRHAAAVWVHGAGEAARLGWGGQLLPGLVDAGVVVLSYDKRGVGESEGECCPGDTGHFNLLTADAVGAVQALRTLPEVDPARVGLVGANEGPEGYDPRRDLSAMTMPGLWEFGTADEHTPSEQSEQVLQALKRQGHDFTVVTFPGAGHGLLDNPPTDPDATPSLIAWVTSHDG